MSPVTNARSDFPGTVLPLSASCSVQRALLGGELSGREEAVHSAGHTAAEPSVKEYKTAFPSTCHLLTIWSYKYEHRSSENIIRMHRIFGNRNLKEISI